MPDHLFKKICLVATYCFLLVLIVVRFNSIYQFGLQALGLLSPFFVGLAIAFILNKPMLWFQKMYSKVFNKPSVIHSLSICTAYIFFVFILIAIFTFIVPQLIDSIKTFIGNLGFYLQNLESFVLRITEDLHITPEVYSKLFDQFNMFIKDITTFTLTYLGNLIPQIANLTSSILSVVFNTVIAVVVSVNLLAGKDKFLAQAKQITYTYTPYNWAKRIEHIFKLSSDIFSKYVIGQLTEACILGILCFIGMKIFGFEYAILISTLIAITALIPVIGAYIGGGVAFLLLAMLSPIKALLFVVYLCILQQLENSIIYPRVVGSSLGLPGVWVIFAVTVGGGLFGLPGILLSVPIMSIIYALISEDVKTKKCETLL